MINKINLNVSIIVCVYNSEKYISKCIKSILKQTYKNFELIIINDGSTDNTYSYLKKLSNTDKRISLINQSNQGVAASRNLGLKVASGKYITFVDSDDWIDKNYIKDLIENAVKYHADIVSASKLYSVEEYNKQLRIIQPKRKFRIFKERVADALFLGADTNFMCGKLIKRSIFYKNNIVFPTGRVYEDVGTMYKIYDSSSKLVITNQAKYFYRMTSNSITHTSKLSGVDDQIFYLKEMINYRFKHKYVYLNAYILLKGFSAMSSLYKSDKISINTKKKYIREIYNVVGSYKFNICWLKINYIDLIKIISCNYRFSDKILSFKYNKKIFRFKL